MFSVIIWQSKFTPDFWSRFPTFTSGFYNLPVACTINRLQYLTMEGLLGVDKLSGSANVQNLTFTWVEFHA